jgi:hypothetical protein
MGSSYRIYSSNGSASRIFFGFVPKHFAKNAKISFGKSGVRYPPEQSSSEGVPPLSGLLGSAAVRRDHGCAEQRQRIKVESVGDALNAPERQIALASLNAAHVGAVDAQNIGESLLAQAPGTTVGPQVAADHALEIAFHIRERSLPAT